MVTKTGLAIPCDPSSCLQTLPLNRRSTALENVRNSQLGGAAEKPPPEDMQTIVWTRDLNKVDPREIEGCEDLLDAYFLMVKFQTPS